MARNHVDTSEGSDSLSRDGVWTLTPRVFNAIQEPHGISGARLRGSGSEQEAEYKVARGARVNPTSTEPTGRLHNTTR